MILTGEKINLYYILKKKPSPYRAVNTLPLNYKKNQLINAV